MRGEHGDGISSRGDTIRADAETKRVYDRLRTDFGEADPRMSGYVSERMFFRQRALVIEAVGDAPGTVLDVACGAGLVSRPLAEAGRRVVGVEFNAAVCGYARRNGIEAIRGDAFALPLAEGMADVVLNVEFAQELRPPAIERLLREMARVLRPGGRLVMVWSNRRALVHRLFAPIVGVLERLRGRSLFMLYHHPVAGMRAAGEGAGLAVHGVSAIFPPLGLRLRRSDGFLASLIGSNFVVVFRKPADP